MPPKKDKSKGKGKKGKEKKVKIDQEPQLEHVDENTKQFFLLQIKDLEEKLIRYQKKCDELDILCKKYENLYETSNTDKKDIVSNLKKELEKKTDEILDLNDRLVGLQQAKDAEKEAFDKQLTDLRNEFQETKDNLTNQNNSLLAKLTALEEFKSQKEELLAKLESLENQIRFLENDHEDKLNEIEKKVIIDKDRLKKDMIVKVSQVAAEFRRVSNKQMADTTKRTIKENVSINNQLQKMSKKATELVEENDKFKHKGKVYKQHVELLEENEKELAKKNVSNLKIIRMLTDKCQNQESIIFELEQKYNELYEQDTNKENLIKKYEDEVIKMKNIQKENQDIKEQIKKIEAELESSIKYRKNIENILKQVTDTLVIALTKNTANVKNELVNTEIYWEELKKRDSMLESLLILLNGAAKIGIGPSPLIFSSDYPELAQKHSLNAGEFPGKKFSKELNCLNELNNKNYNTTFHYQPGDLGFVPKKKDHILSNFEKMKLLQPQKELGNLQKLTKKSVATQTLDFTRASIFGVDSDEKFNSIFEDKSKRLTRAQSFVPLNALNRVIDKVF